jgi:phenylalanyl-tRNA synthetase alpha chain
VSNPTLEIEAGLEALGKRYREDFSRAATEHELRHAHAALLGKKGELTSLLRLMGQVPLAEKRAVGERVNQARSEVEAAFETRLLELRRAERQAELEAPPFDLTLPGRVPAPRGHIHPVTRALWQILDTFRSLGFEVAWGPEVELEENNFTKLAFPADHPATDMQDSFWVEVAQARPERVLLRTHTSPVQVRQMIRHGHRQWRSLLSAGR